MFREPDYEFLAEAVLNQIRKGKWPNPDEAQLIMRLPVIAAIRCRLTKSDASRCVEVVEGREDTVAAFASLLLRPYCADSVIHDRLLVRWKSASPELQCHLLWRILDDPELSLNIHEQLFQFVLMHWQVWKSTIDSFYHSDPERVLEKVKARLLDTSIPESKKWVYLCGLPEFASDQQKARDLIVLYGAETAESFSKDVCHRLVQRFWPEHSLDSDGV